MSSDAAQEAREQWQDLRYRLPKSPTIDEAFDAGFDAGARHALEEAANGNVPGELSKDARRQVEAWLRALAVGDNRNQEN